MTQRGTGFKICEDVILCEAYVVHTTNSEIGTYQRKKDLWENIKSTYNHEALDKLGMTNRNTKSLLARMDKLGSSCTLFRACLTQTASRVESGSNEVDMLKNAKDIYKVKEPKGQAFKYDHAWEILKYHEKWAEHSNESSHAGDVNSTQEGSIHISQESDEAGDVGIQRLRSSSEGRPAGRSAAKARRKNTSERDPIWQEMMNSTAKLMERQHADREARANSMLTIAQRKLDHKEKKLRLMQQQQEMEIMNKDLRNLTPFSKAFWSSKKRDIVENADMPRAARSLDFNEGEGSREGDEDVYIPETFDRNRGGDDYTGYNNTHADDDFPLE